MINPCTMRKAVCILVFNEDGKILGVSRKNDATNFGLPGGKVDSGETEEQAVLRELLEETGLRIFDIRKVFEHTEDREYWTSCWSGRIEGSIHTNEAGVVRWVDKETLMRGAFGEYNRRLFKAMNLL